MLAFRKRHKAHPVSGMMHPLTSVAHIDIATLSGGKERSFVFLDQSDKVDINLLNLHEKACYFEGL